MDPIALLALAVLAAVAGLWLWRRQGAATQSDEVGARGQRVDALDTVAGWPPESTRVLTLQERRAYSLLAQALPDYMVLAQVPVSRFIRVPTRNSYHEWMRRVGQLCADLVICDPASQVIAVVEVRRPPNKDSERTRKRHDRMDRVLRKAGVRVIEWNEEALPHRDAVREQILPTPKGMSSEEGAAAVSTRPASPPLPAAGLRPRPAGGTATGAAVMSNAAQGRARGHGDGQGGSAQADDELLLEPLDGPARRDAPSPADPTPSTWFDELESERVPLDRPKA